MKICLKIVLSIIAAIFALILGFYASYLIITANTHLDESKLYENQKTVAIFDSIGNKITNTSLGDSKSVIDVESLNDYTINAFIASEDRDFFKHKGVNHKRILKAIYKNIKAKSFKEGASTITQQLIKNTHLDNNKTITRKFKEIKLAKELERKYTKNEILSAYLNTIYFGHGHYGIESASKFYFGTSASNLTIEQSAMLAGLLTSPNNNSPFKNSEKCLKKRNTVLKSMLDCGHIDEQTYKSETSKPITASKNNEQTSYNDYLTEVFYELENAGFSPYQTQNKLNVYTNLDTSIQNYVNQINFDNDGAIIIRSTSGEVVAFKSTCNLIKRQIGSTAKPIFVYAPALNEKKIELFTKIYDEKINYGGYSPQNHDKKYHGYVSVEDAITQSLNVPAVKTINALTLNKAAEYANKLGINLDDKDKNLSLALGAMHEGLTIKELCDSYSSFPSQGVFTKSYFLKYVADENGNIIYKPEDKSMQAFSPSTASLINKALINASKYGTARRLNEIDFDIACKTGTCGTSDGNTDAYACAYTSKHLIGVWLGDKNNKKLNINGGKSCCDITKSLITKIYNNQTPPRLDTTTGVKQIEIDKYEYEKNCKAVLCDNPCPPLNKLTVICSIDNLPKDKSTKFSHPQISQPTYSVKNNIFNLQLCQTEYYDYIIKRKNNGKIDIVYDGSWINTFKEELSSGEYEYCIIPYYPYKNDKYFGEEIWLPKILILQNKTNDSPPSVTNKDWFDSSF